MAEASSIFEAATACRHIWRTAIKSPRLMQQEWAENRLADFNLWAMGAGASSTGKASLDYRLRTNPEAHTILLNLLLMLRILLQKCIDGCRKIEDTVVELSGEESARMKDVEDSLNQLTRLTVAIRKAGTRSRLRKADSSFDPEGPQIRSLRRHLEFLILARPDENRDSYLGEEQFDSARLSPIQLRLISANLKRRNRFIYAQRHAQKLDNSSERPKNTPRGKLRLVKHSRHFDLAQTSILVNEDNALIKDDPQTQSTTTATVVDEQIEIPSAHAIRSATTVVSVTSSRITYPKCPPLHDHQMLFTCPCCCQSLPASIGRGSHWKKHLMGDILPYTCIVEDCPQADMFYMTKEIWLSHMGEEHGDTVQWVCHACSQKNIYATFRDPVDFTAHLEQQHSKGIRPNQIPMLLSSWRRKVPFEISACPLCDFQSDDQTALLDHTAEHTHSFSLRSLPWAPRDALEIYEDEEEEYGGFFDEYPYFDVDSSWSEPSASSPRESRLASDLGSIADSDSGGSAHSMHDPQRQEGLTEDLLSQVPHDIPGEAGTSDWLGSLTPDSAPEDRLGLLLSNELEITALLSVGSRAVVYTAVDIHTQISYAVKAYSKLNTDFHQSYLQRQEIKLHHEVGRHPNVVPILRIVDATNCLYIVLEFFPEGDLFYSIVEQGNYVGNDPLAKHAFIQILDAVQYCHSVGIYHRNIQPENILVADGGRTLKLGDFSLASTESSTSDFGCGSAFYMSPECQQESPPPNASFLSAPNDVWSLGVTLVNLTCGRNPWKRASIEDPTYNAYTKDPFFLQSILPLSTELVLILNRIFEPDPSKRITIPELYNSIQNCPVFTTHSRTPYVTSSEPDPPWQDPDDLEGENQYDFAPDRGWVRPASDSDNTSITSPFFEDDEWMNQSSGGQ